MTVVTLINLNLFRKCCTKHQRLSMASVRHGILFNNTSDLWLKSHVKHSIGFIKNQVPAETCRYHNVKYYEFLQQLIGTSSNMETAEC